MRTERWSQIIPQSGWLESILIAQETSVMRVAGLMDRLEIGCHDGVRWGIGARDKGEKREFHKETSAAAKSTSVNIRDLFCL